MLTSDFWKEWTISKAAQNTEGLWASWRCGVSLGVGAEGAVAWMPA